ncbi:MAG: prepilin-type N-terminal cleavage/methylation domain-containing protein [Nitrospirota bacterium]|nr:prepilin-type N-terminal cleavage/methylation domain-containing protein [Nitrospirota bacterium]
MKHVSNEKGFTLVELMISLVILAVGLLAMAGMQIEAIRGNKFAGRLSYMTAVSQEVMESFMARSGDDAIFDTAASNVAYPQVYSAQGVGTVNATYSIVLNTPVPNVVTITVSVTSGGRTLTVSSFKRAT